MIIWLREVDVGTDNACWLVCAKGDPGAVAFTPLKSLSSALLTARDCIRGHFDDDCEECRNALACCDSALSPNASDYYIQQGSANE